MNSKTLFEQRAGLIAQARAIYDKAAAEKRQPNTEEVAAFDKLMDEADKTHVEAQRQFRLETAEADLRASAGRAVPPAPVAGTATRTNPQASPEYAAAYRSWLKFGNSGLSPTEYRVMQEARAVQADSPTIGGYLTTPEEFNQKLIRFVNNLVFVRGLATKFTVATAQSLGAPSLDADPADADWTSELATGNEDSTMAFGKRELYPRPVAKRLKASNRLLRMVPAVDDLIIERLGYKFAVTEEKAFMTGTGATQPLGIFTPSANGISTGRDTTSINAGSIVADDFIATVFSLKQQYIDAKDLRWVMARATMKTVRQFKDLNNQYLWQPAGLGSNISEPSRMDSLLNIPVAMSEYAPSTISTGKYIAALGVFSHYWIADALNFTIERLVELYAETNQTGFIGRKELDGMPVLEEAFARLIVQ